MYVMGIETSCDETAVSIIERGNKDRVICEKIKSQIPIHKKYGGIVPEIASRSHYEAISYLTKEALEEANLKIEDIDLIALTQGPGLIGSLLVGLSFAKALAYSKKIPLVMVDHIDAHIESPFITNKGIEYPLLSLVVSGGHTSIFHKKSKFESELISKTRDDAIGEVMDKVAKYFGLGYPGGPIIDKNYPKGDPKAYNFTIPRMSDGSNDLSFSGYKTAVINYGKKDGIEKNTKEFYDLCASFLNSIVKYLLKKTKNAISEINEKNIKSLSIAGGVSRNSRLREAFKEEFGKSDIILYMPEPIYCTDNGSMVAWLGYEKFKNFPEKDYFDYSSNVYSRATFRTKNNRHR